MTSKQENYKMTTNLHISSNITILAMGASREGHRYIKVRVRASGRRRVRMFSMHEFELAPDHTIASLGAGLVTSKSRAEFRRHVERASRILAPTFRVATRTGWFGNRFVLANGKVLGASPLNAALPELFDEFGGKFVCRGSLSGWRRIAELAAGNSRLIAALALSFSGPVVSLLGVEAPGIQLVGAPGAGKSGIAIAAGSVWGARPGELGTFVESWNSTTNKLERTLAAHSSAFVALDETRAFERAGRRGFEAFAQAIMRIAEGRMKGRTNEIGVLTWQTPILSTSNLSLDAMAIVAGTEIDDALRGRLIDIPLPEGRLGAFENLHGFADHAAFTVELLRLARENHGVASVALVEGMIAWLGRGEGKLLDWLHDCRKNYLRVIKRRVFSASRDLTRFHQRFATVFASGCLAIALGIVPWTRNALGTALISCEQAHVDLVAGNNAAEVAQVNALDPIERLREHVFQMRRAFVDLRRGLIPTGGAHVHAACEGYVNFSHSDVLEFLFSEAKLQAICGGKGPAVRVKQQLDAAGMLIRDGARPCTRRTIWADGNHKREHVVAIRADYFRNQ
jgi:hypothetical protein